MNYIKEINAFYDWLEINELSASAVNLWYALMHINNKAGWIETFTVAESVLSIKSGLSGRTIRNARNELKQKGRIDFKSRSGGKAPIYTIISFETGLNAMAKPKENISEANSKELSTDSSKGTSEKVSTLYKLNKTKLNNKEMGDKLADNGDKFRENNPYGQIKKIRLGGR